MANLAEFRKKYPNAADYSDAELLGYLSESSGRSVAEVATDFGVDVGQNNGDFVRNVKGSWENLKGTGAGLVGLAGGLVGADGVKQWGLERAQENFGRAGLYRRESDDFTNIDSLGGAVDWAQGAAGQLTPQLLFGVGTAAAGGAIARRGVSAATRAAIEREVAGTAIMAGTESTAARQLGALSVNRVLNKAMERGAMAGVAAGSIGQEAGSIYPEMVAEGHDDPLRALGYGVAAGAMDALPEMRAISRVFGGHAPGNMLARAAREGGKQALFEGSTEVGQTAIERNAAYKPLWNDEARKEYINAGAVGAFGGGMMGGVTGAVSRPPITSQKVDLLTGAQPNEQTSLFGDPNKLNPYGPSDAEMTQGASMSAPAEAARIQELMRHAAAAGDMRMFYTLQDELGRLGNIEPPRVRISDDSGQQGSLFNTPLNRERAAAATLRPAPGTTLPSGPTLVAAEHSTSGAAPADSFEPAVTRAAHIVRAGIQAPVALRGNAQFFNDFSNAVTLLGEQLGPKLNAFLVQTTGKDVAHVNQLLAGGLSAPANPSPTVSTSTGTQTAAAPAQSQVPAVKGVAVPPAGESTAPVVKDDAAVTLLKAANIKATGARVQRTNALIELRDAGALEPGEFDHAVQSLQGNRFGVADEVIRLAKVAQVRKSSPEAQLEYLLGQLTPKERDVLERVSAQEDMADIGKVHGITKDAVSKAHAKIITKLAKAGEVLGVDPALVKAYFAVQVKKGVSAENLGGVAMNPAAEAQSADVMEGDDPDAIAAERGAEMGHDGDDVGDTSAGGLLGVQGMGIAGSTSDMATRLDSPDTAKAQRAQRVGTKLLERAERRAAKAVAAEEEITAEERARQEEQARANAEITARNTATTHPDAREEFGRQVYEENQDEGDPSWDTFSRSQQAVLTRAAERLSGGGAQRDYNRVVFAAIEALDRIAEAREDVAAYEAEGEHELAKIARAKLELLEGDVDGGIERAMVPPEGAGEEEVGLKFSKREEGGGSSADALRSKLQKLFFSRDRFNQRITIVQTEEEAARVSPKFAATYNSKTDKGQVQGFVQGDKIVLIAGNIAPGKELAVFLHEVGVHIGLTNLLTSEQLNQLVDQVAGWAQRDDGSLESRIAKKAHDRVMAAHGGTITDMGGLRAAYEEELIAYFVEEAVLAGVDPLASNSGSTALDQWFRVLWAAAKVALRRIGLGRFDQLTAQNIVDLTFGAARLEITGVWSGFAIKFRNPRDKYVGAGEGTSWESWGHYNTQARKVAKWYMEADEDRKRASGGGALQVAVGGEPLVDTYGQRFSPGRLVKMGVLRPDGPDGHYALVDNVQQHAERRAEVLSARRESLRERSRQLNEEAAGIKVWDAEAQKFDDAKRAQRDRLRMLRDIADGTIGRMTRDLDVLERIVAGGITVTNPQPVDARIYRSDVALDDDRVVQWSVPLKEQPEVQAALEQALEFARNYTMEARFQWVLNDVRQGFLNGGQIIRQLESTFEEMLRDGGSALKGLMPDADFKRVQEAKYEPHQFAAVAFLRDKAGLQGVRYATAQGKDKDNVVVWSDKRIQRVATLIDGDDEKIRFSKTAPASAAKVDSVVQQANGEGTEGQDAPVDGQGVEGRGSEGSEGGRQVPPEGAGQEEVSGPRPSALRRLGRAVAEALGVVSPWHSRIRQLIDAADGALPPDHRMRGAAWARRMIVAAQEEGDLTPTQAALGLWLLDKNPALARNLKLIRMTVERMGPTRREEVEGTAAFYRPADQFLMLIGKRGSDEVVSHELLHHTERMMSERAQAGIEGEWAAAFAAAVKRAERAGDGNLLSALGVMAQALAGGRSAAVELHRLFVTRVLDVKEHYQLVSPSEFWAENASRILARRAEAEGSWVSEAKAWLSEFVQKVKALFGLRSDAAVIRGLEEVLRSGGEFVPGATMMVERVAVKAPAEVRAIDPAAAKVDSVVQQALDSPAWATAKHFGRKVNFSLLFGHQLVEKIGALIPAAKAFFGTLQQKVALRERREEQVLELADKFYRMSTAVQAQANKFLQESTVSQKWGYQPEWDAEAQVDADMAAKFAALPTDAQALVKKVFAYGNETQREYEQVIRDLVDAELSTQVAEAKASKDESRMKALEKERTRLMKERGGLKAMLAGPYAPLVRFGQYVVAVKSPEFRAAEAANDSAAKEKMQSDPAHYTVRFFESMYEAQKAYRAMRAEHGANVDEPVQREPENTHSSELPVQAIKRVQHALESGPDGEKLSANTKRILTRITSDLYIASLDSLSARHSQQRRRNIAGADEDMMRAFVSQGQGMARLLAALETTDALQGSLQDMRSQAREGQRTTEKADALNEVLMRYAAMMDSRPTPIQDKVMATTSTWMLLTNPAYWLSNATQPWMMSLPVLAGRFAFGRAKSALFKSYGKVWSALDGRTFDPSKIKNPVARSADMLKALLDRGHIDLTLEQDLGRFANPGAFGSPAAQWVMSGLRYIPQRVELVNRVATALAAYELEYTQLTSTGMNADLAHDQATEYADSVILDTHGDYSAAGAPRMLMQGGKKLPVKLMGQFRKFQLIQFALIAKVAKQAFSKKMSPEERAVGRASLGWLLGIYGTATGLTGLVGVKTLAFLISAIFGDDDEKDLDLVLTRELGDRTAAQLLLHGVPAAFGMDVSNRLGMGNVTSPFPFADHEPSYRKTYENYLMAATGPFVGGLVPRAASGIDYIRKGEYWKGLELLVPNGVTNAMRAARMAGGGVTNAKGDTLLDPDELEVVTVLFQSVGLPTTQLTERQWKSDALYDTDSRMRDRVNTIRLQYAEAAKDQDREAMGELRQEWMDVQEMRKRNGMKPQPLSRLLKVPRDQKEREALADEGVALTKANAGFARSVPN